MKKFLIILCSILCFVCVGIDIWCMCIYQFADEKHVSNTVNIGLMETADGEQKKAFMEIVYYSNKNKNGLEMLEIKYNYFADENNDTFLSVGQQFVASDVNSSIGFDVDSGYTTYKTIKKYRKGLKYVNVHNVFFGTHITDATSLFEYQASNDNFISGNDINRLTSNSKFKITIGNENYRLSFKNYEAVKDFYLGSVSLESAFTSDVNHRYQCVNDMLLASKLLGTLKGAEFTSGTYEVLQFADFFNYEKYDGSVYKPLDNVNNNKVKTDFTNNYVVKITKSEDGVKQASDSLFKQVQGNSRFNYAGTEIYDDYSFGKCGKVIDISAFNYSVVNDKSVVLKLKEDVMNELLKDTEHTLLIKIDLDYLSELGFDFVGFSNDCHLEDLSIYKILTTQTIDGKLVEKEITL